MFITEQKTSSEESANCVYVHDDQIVTISFSKQCHLKEKLTTTTTKSGSKNKPNTR